MSVIVTNAKNRIAYSVVRSLGQRGIELYTADFLPYAMASASRYSRAHFLYPSPFREQERFVQCLIENAQRLRADVLIPVYEETFLIAKHAERISKHVSMVVPSYEKILVAHNKDKWAEVARRLGIPVPRSCEAEDLRSGAVKVSELHYPVIVKPKQGGGGWALQHVESPEALRSALASDHRTGLPWSRFFVQEKIPGEVHCVAMLMNRGRVRARVAYRQLREYPATGGQATTRVSIRSPKADAYLEQLLENLAWHGVCQADFIVDNKTQIPYLIDLNPRLWGSLVQAIASGVDFPYLIYRLAREGDVAVSDAFRTGVVTRWIGGELGAFFPHLARSTAKVRFLKNFFLPPVRAALYDDFSWLDPLPFVAWLADAVLRMLRHRSLKAVSHDSLEGIWE